MWVDEVEHPLPFGLLQDLLASGESDTVEFKKTVPPDQVIARNLTSFANTSGGILFIGVNETGSPVGLPETEVERAKSRLNVVCKSLFAGGGIDYEFGEEKLLGRTIAYAFVGRAPDSIRPVATSRGEIFRRAGSAIIAEKSRSSKSVRQEKLRVFVAMSFREEEEPVLVDYWQAMCRAATTVSADIEMRRIDLQEGDYEISQEVMAEIDAAAIVIADFTLSSRNVYFELGYARGKNKRLIQTARKNTILEFDIRNWRTLFYRNATELEERLVAALGAAVGTIAG